MPYDPAVAHRIRTLLGGVERLTERKMFGGVGFMIGGNLAVGAHSNGGMLIRCTKEDFVEYLSLPGAGPMKRGTTPMSGWIVVDADAIEDEADLAVWVTRGREFAEALPAKKK